MVISTVNQWRQGEYLKGNLPLEYGIAEIYKTEVTLYRLECHVL